MRKTLNSLLVLASLLLPGSAMAADYNWTSSSGNSELIYFGNTGVNPKIIVTADGNGEGTGVQVYDVQYGVNANASGSYNASGGVFGATAPHYSIGVEVAAYGSANSSYNRGGYFNAGGPDYSSNYALRSEAYGGDYSANYGIWASAGGGTGSYNRAGYFDGDVALYNIDWLSDRRFKTNIRDISGGLAKVMALKPRGYEYKVDEYKGRMRFSKGEKLGFIAQELAEVLPELVHDQKTPVSLTAEEKKNGVKKESIEYKSVDYVGVIPVLVKAVQEQQAEIASLRAEVASLKAAK